MGERVGDRLTARQRRVLAAGLEAGDVSASGLARYGDADPGEAIVVLAAARTAGVLGPAGVAPEAATELLAELDPATKAAVHAAACRHLAELGGEHLPAAVDHAHRAVGALPPGEVVGVTEAAGRWLLREGDYAGAADLLAAADDLDPESAPARRASRLIARADALVRMGRPDEGRDAAAHAVTLAEAAGDAGLAAFAAVAYAFPPDWQAGDLRAADLLSRAAALGGGLPEQAMVRAAGAVLGMRVPAAGSSLGAWVPAAGEDTTQTAWVTRPTVAQPLADDAMDLADRSGDPAARLLARLAWRATHRSPRFLDRRRVVSAEALDLAQVLRRTDRLVEAAVWCATDALEAADRPGYDAAVAMACWAADQDPDPKAAWWARTLEAGSALLDGDVERADGRRQAAALSGQEAQAPGWVAAELFLSGEAVLARGEVSGFAAYLVPTDDPALASPLARVSVAWMLARSGRPDEARENLHRVLRQFDEESSLLLQGVLAARVALFLDDVDAAEPIRRVLEPWTGRVAVDSNAWWCGGPVDLALAAVAVLEGDMARAAALVASGAATADRLGDVRSRRWAAELRAVLGASGVEAQIPASPANGASPADGVHHRIDRLSDRQRSVLVAMARGATNPEIADQLAYSMATVRRETIAIYRILGVHGRAEAAAVAVAAGLAAPGAGGRPPHPS